MTKSSKIPKVQIFRFDGRTYNGSLRSDRTQIFITDIKTNQEYCPVITKANKAYSKLMKHKIYWYEKDKLESHKPVYFTAAFSRNLTMVGSLRNVVFLSEEEILDKYAEYLL